VNSLFHDLDNTWLPKYGSISSEYLHYDSPLDFLELLPIASKILGKDFKRTAEKLIQEILPLRNYYEFIRKQNFKKSSHF